MSVIEKKVLQAFDRYNLPGRGLTILVGLSGGPDSVALLHILANLRKKLEISLGAAYIDHCLRPQAVKKEIAFCQKLCRARSIPFYVEKIDIPGMAKKDRTGIEETARNYRYKALNDICGREGYDLIALGHHADDRVETILFNLFRGSGREGIIGFRPHRDNIIRPLYDLARSEIENYLADKNLEYMIDASNKEFRFTRNRIRNQVLPLISSEINAAAPHNILRMSRILEDEETYLAQVARKTAKKIFTDSPGGQICLDLTSFCGYDKWLRRRLIRLALERVKMQEITFFSVDQVLKTAENGGRRSLPEGLTVERYGENAYIYRSGRRIRKTPLKIPGETIIDFPHLCFRSRIFTLTTKKDLKKDPARIAWIDADRLNGNLYIDGMKTGERFHPFNRPGSKKAGDFLTDRKYPRPLRQELPVIYDAAGIIWLAGIEIDDRVKVGPKTVRVLKIEIRRSRT